MVVIRFLVLLLFCILSFSACKSWGRFWISNPVALNTLNVRANQPIESGFLTGGAESVDGVEVSFDGAAYQSAILTGSGSAQRWRIALPLPASGIIWKHNSLHIARIRGVFGGDTYSNEVTITFRKGENRDVNGDGYSDLIVGATAYNTNTGRAYIFLGSAAGISATDAAQSNILLQGTATSQFFATGRSAWGDVNGDGYADALIGAEGYNANNGGMFIFYGGSTGIANLAAPNAIVGGTGGTFARRIVTGDFNGDGYSDALVGAEGVGNAYIFHGGASGITAATVAGANTTLTGEGGNFTTGLAVGDINGDGYSDALVGAWLYNANNGRAYVFHGSASGVASIGAAAAPTRIDGVGTERAGAGVHAADFNNDGFDDLIVASTFHASIGRIGIFFGASSGIAPQAMPGNINIVGESPGSNSEFGSSLESADLNGDGLVDLVVSAYVYPPTSTGKTYVFYNANGYLPSGTSNLLAARAYLGESTSNNFGGTIRGADLNGDGYAELYVGAPNFSASQGKVYQYLGNSGLPAASTLTILGVAGTESFGGSMR